MNTLQPNPQIDIENYPLKCESILLDDKITCYVEGMKDQQFWKDIFQTFAPTLQIIFYPHSRDNKLKSSKTSVLTENNIKEACATLILCVDSDLEYLLKNEPLFSHPYIFHTYTYSIENYKISPIALERIAEKSSYLQTSSFSFVDFIKDYSKITFPLLVYILYFEKIKLEKIAKKQEVVSEILLSEKELKSVLCITLNNRPLADNAKDVMTRLQKQVSNVINNIKKKHTNIDLTPIQGILLELNIKEEDTYWYLNGHIMYDCVVKILLKKVIIEYKKEKKECFKSQEQTTLLTNKQDEYQNLIKETQWETLLNDGYMYCLSSLNHCPLIQKIQQDIKKFQKKCPKTELSC